MNTPMIPRLGAALIATALAAAGLPTSARAAITTVDWKPFTTLGTYNWSAAGNWTATTGTPESGSSLVINFDPSKPGTSATGIGQSITSTNDMGTVQLNTLNLSGTSTGSGRTFTITGGALQFAGTGAAINITTGTGGTGGLVDYVINNNLLLDSDLALNLNGSGATTLANAAGSTISANSAGLKTITVSGAGNAIIGSNTRSLISDGSGQVGITMNGSGLLSLGGTNTFSGGVLIKSGTVGWNGSSPGVLASFGTGTIRLGDTTGSTGATLNFSKAITITNTIVVQAGSSGAKILENTALNTTAVLGGLLILNDNLTARYINTASGGFTFGSSTTAPFLTGTGNLTLENNGLFYHTISGNNPGFTGSVIIKSGTTRISGGSSLSAANAVSVDSLNNATFNINQVSTTIAGLSNGANGGGLVINPGAARTLTLGGTGNYSFGGTISATTPANLALTVNMTGTQTFSGTSLYTGAITVQKGTLILSGPNSTAALTTVQNGTLKLDFSGANAPANNIIPSGSNLIFGGTTGSNTLWVAGKANTTNTQTFSAFTMIVGAAHLKLTTAGTGSTIVNLGPMTSTSGRSYGATLDISMPAGTLVRTTATNTLGGTLYNAITLNGADLAKNDGSGNVVAFTGYIANTATSLGAGGRDSIADMSGGNTTLSSGGVTSLAGLRFNTAASSTLTLASSTARELTIGGGWPPGPILVTPSVGNNLSRITGGIVQGISSRDLVIIQNNAIGDLQIDSVLTDFGTNSNGLTKSGAGRLVLGAGNTYQGTNYLNEGTVVVAADATSGNSQTLTTSLGSSVINSVNTTGLFVGQRVYGTYVTGAAAGTYITSVSPTSVTLSITSTSGGTGSVTFGNSGGLGVLTGNGAVLLAVGATLQIGNNGATGSLIAGQNITDNGTVAFRRTDNTLVFSNTISGAGSLAQLGAGMVTLGAANTYTGATVLNDGTLQFSALNNLGAGTAVSFGGGALKWAVGNSADISGRTVTIGAGGAIFDTNTNDVIFANAIGNNGGGGLTKNGLGILTLNGDNSYTGTTVINAGTLKLASGASLANSAAITVGNSAAFDGSAAPVTIGAGKSLINNGAFTGNLTVNGTLGGSGSISGDINGSGLVSPGNSPGILTAGQVTPTSGMSFAFEFTGTGSPLYGSSGASGNDVLRITNTTTPFTSALIGANTVSAYFTVTSVANADLFKGAFYTDANSDFLTTIQSATFNYYVKGDGAGTHAFNGVNYYTATEFDPTLSFTFATLAENADFGNGTVNGYVTQFSAVVPEPAALALFALGGLALLRRRRV